MTIALSSPPPVASLFGVASGREQPDPLAILSSVGEAVYDWDLLTDVLRWSPNAAAVLQTDAIESIGTGRAFHEQTTALSVSSRRDAVLNGGRADTGSGVPYQVRYGLQRDSAGRPETLWIDDTGRWFAGPDGRPAHAHGLVRVASARGETEQDVSPRSDVDALTGCVSRSRLLRVLSAMLDKTTGKPVGGPRAFGLLLIGIDDLAQLNRLHGYDAVDAMMVAIATALRTQIRSTDCLARYVGNKFALVLSHCDAEQIALAAARATDLLMQPPAGGAIRASVRIGGVLAPGHGRNVQALLLNAENALGDTSGAKRFRLFDPAAVRHEDARRAQDVAAEIVAALNEGRVRIALQPIVAARSGETVMHEALVRIVMPDADDETHRVLEPSSILPAAAQAGLLPLLDHRVLELVVAQLLDRPGTISLNVSGATLRDPEWPARVATMASLNPGIAARLVVEVAEEDAAADDASGVRALAAVAAQGVRVAIDHFGAGHASLRALRRLNPDFLKVDGAFVQNLSRSPDDRFLVRSLLGVARQIGAPVIAEWVENAGTAAVLAEWGATLLQGTLFGGAEMPAAGAARRAAVA